MMKGEGRCRVDVGIGRRALNILVCIESLNPLCINDELDSIERCIRVTYRGGCS